MAYKMKQKKNLKLKMVYPIEKAKKSKVDLYVEKYIKGIKMSVTDEELANVINRIYTDGFQDGVESEESIRKELKKGKVK